MYNRMGESAMGEKIRRMGFCRVQLPPFTLKVEIEFVDRSEASIKSKQEVFPVLINLPRAALEE
jgi:hypothetical protein